MNPELALLGHPADYEGLCRQLMRMRPDYESSKLQRFRPTYEALFSMLDPYVHDRTIEIPTADGTLVGVVVVCPFLPSSVPARVLAAASKVRDGIAVAAATGAKVIALGGFTSIVAVAARLDLELLRSDAEVVTGNRLTSAFTLAQFDDVVAARGVSASTVDVAIIGATGDIGSACAIALAGRVRQLILVGRNENKLRALADRLSGGSIRISEDVGAASLAHIVIAATSAAEPILDEETLAPGTVVLDVGYPASIRSTSSASRVSVVHAGLATLPWDLGIDYLTGLEGRLMFGCYAEAITLALNRRRTRSGPNAVAAEDLPAVAAGFGITPAAVSSGTDGVSLSPATSGWS